PVLYHLFEFLGVDESVRMHVAVGTSLATIVPTAISSARSHHRRGGIDFDLLRSWGPWIFTGALLGAAVGSGIKGSALTGVFALVALAVAANMAFRPEGSAIAGKLPGLAVRAPLAFSIGGLSVLMGIGGGTLSVPILSAFSYPIRRAVGTAAAIGLFIALPGVAGFALAEADATLLPPGTFGYVNLIGFALIVPVTVVAAPVGARIAHAIDPSGLRRVFALFLFLTSVKMLWRLF
ncbi:MAG: sulfite exporter TauE/SafE family protein, partial [Alphaproteobacteria bacterium]|nr:sulfite exporter TauE/SafE family protein [Alphaproteobacteria bacterium]